MQDEIAVSVICITYNHKKYIRQALDSIIMQETDFQYEIIVHDDASTDGTTNIIHEYEEKYPELIRPIYEEKNQFSRSLSFMYSKIFKRVRGRYFTLTDGDDYWTDNEKLQIQYDAMEEHPNIDLCAHLVRRVDADTGANRGFLGPTSGDMIYDVSDVIKNHGGFIGTSSLLMRSSMNDNIMRFQKAYMFDYTFQIRGSLRGGMLYLGREMSVYRENVEDGWVRTIRRHPKARIAVGKRMLNMFRLLDEETAGKYRKTIVLMYIEEVFKQICYGIYGVFIKVFGYHERHK